MSSSDPGKMAEKHRPLLEVIACSVTDAVAAEQGGADRLELISRFDLGGLTPALLLVREVLQAVRIPVRVMLRETEDFSVRDAGEQQRLCALFGELSQLPVDGIVCGFLQDGGIDHELLSRILNEAPQTRVTFHRAFEELPDPAAAIAALKRYPQIDRILTSGGPGTSAEKLACLNLCDQFAQPEITILAGGGLTADVVRDLRGHSTIREFHLGTFVRQPVAFDGEVVAEKVRAIRALLDGD